MRSVTKLILFLAAVLTAAPCLAAQADLGIVKRLVTAPSGVFAAQYEISVTNYGPDAVGPIFVTDTPGPNLAFDIDFIINGAPSPWVCTFDGPPATTVTCIHPGPLAVGNTVTMPIGIAALSLGRHENCASVSLGKVGNTDPDVSNNTDCACTDFKACRDVAIDISTGTAGSVQLNPGASDPDWVVVSTPTATAPNTPAIVVGEYQSHFVDAPPANWISSAFPQPQTSGDYVYELKYSTGSERYLNCIINMDYASDNGVTFTVDGYPLAQNLATDHTAFTMLHPRTWFIPSGTHTIRARVKNNGGPTSLLVKGSIFCSCYSYIDPIVRP